MSPSLDVFSISPLKHISLDEFRSIAVLGRGHFGKVSRLRVHGLTMDVYTYLGAQIAEFCRCFKILEFRRKILTMRHSVQQWKQKVSSYLQLVVGAMYFLHQRK